MDLLTYKVDFPTVVYGLLLANCITNLITCNTLTNVTANHVIDMIKHIGMLGQSLRNN